MKNKDKTLNLKASQAIASLGIECESEKWWGIPSGKKKIELISGGSYQSKPYYDAPSLQELLALLPDIGEKLEWDNAGCVDKIYCNAPPTMSMLEWKAHKLLDTYLSQGMEGCSREIIRLIKEK